MGHKSGVQDTNHAPHVLRHESWLLEAYGVHNFD